MRPARRSRARRGTALRFTLALVALLALNAGGWVWLRWSLASAPVPPMPQVRVTSVTPSAEEPADEHDRISMYFDRALAPESLLGQPLEQAPFEITPRPAGRWVYATPERLDFVLDEPLPAGRAFEVTPVADFMARAGHELSGAGRFEVRTRSLELESARLLFAAPEVASIALDFNQPVDPAALRRHLVVAAVGRSGGAREGGLEYEVVEDAPHADLTLRIPLDGMPEGFDVEAVELRFEAGLTGSDAELGFTAARRERVALPRKFVVLRAESQLYGLDAPSVRIRFSRRLAAGGDVTPPEIAVEPPVPDLRVTVTGSGIRLEGGFEAGGLYEITVPPTVRAQDGAVLEQVARVSADIPRRQRALRFAQRRGTLSPRGNLRLGLDVVELEKVRFDIHRVHANNLVAHLHRRWSSWTARPLGTREVAVERSSAVQQVALDLQALLETDPGGIYLVSARADDTWHRDTAVVAVTDLAIVAKRDERAVHAWVTSIRDGAPVAGAAVEVLSASNQVLVRGTTGDDGFVTLPAAMSHPDGAPWVVVASAGGDGAGSEGAESGGSASLGSAPDMAYLLLDRAPWNVADLDADGRAWPAPIEALVYAERGVYRPGETLHATLLARSADGTASSSLPCTLRLRRPDGRVIAEEAVVTGPQGFAHASFATSPDGHLGPHRVEAFLPGADASGSDEIVLGQAVAHVEEFVPVRLDMTAGPTHARYGADRPLEVRIAASYLAGHTAADLPVQVAGRLLPEPFRSAAQPRFRFETGSADGALALPQVEDRLGDEGRATVEVPWPQELARRAPGRYRVEAVATVQPPGGRAVSRAVEARVDTAPAHVGLLLPDAAVAGTPVSFAWTLRSPDDAVLAAADATMSVAQVTREWTVREQGGEARWESHETLTPVGAAAPLALDPDVPDGVRWSDWTPPGAGRFRITVTDGATGAHGQADVLVAGTGASGLDTERPERVEIALEPATARPGTSVRAVVRSPFAGTLLVAVETDRVTHHLVRRLEVPSTTLELPVPASARGSAFVTAAVVRAVDPAATSWLPHRAFGVARIAIDHAPNRLAIDLSAPQLVEPGAPLVVRVATGNGSEPGATSPDGSSAVPAMVHLWAVDEGILLADAYEVPDPYGWMFAPRRLAVASIDAFVELLPDFAPVATDRIGGDRALARRRAGIPPRRPQGSVLWHAAVPVGADGTVERAWTAPAETGAVRVLAVAADGDAYGSAAQRVVVSAPLVVEASWPRAVAPGDRFQVPVRIANTTDAPMTVTLEASSVPAADGGSAAPDLRMRLIEEGPLAVPARSSVVTWLDVGAGSANDGLSGTFEAVVLARAEGSAGSIVRASREPIAVRSVAPYRGSATIVTVAPGEEVALEASDGFAPHSRTATVHVGTRAATELRPAIEALVTYPYGCVEQTTSRLRALLAADELLDESPEGTLADTAGGGTAGRRAMMHAGIERLRTMQLRSGGFGSWPGGDAADDWATAYVVSALVELGRHDPELARVIRPMLRDASAWLASRLRADGKSAMDLATRTLACRGLASAGADMDSWLEWLESRGGQLDRGGLAHLAMAWIEAGRADRAAGVLARVTVEQLTAEIPSTHAHRLTSICAQDGLLLEAMLAARPEDPMIELLGQRLLAAREDGAWSTTIDNAMAVRAVGRWLRRAPAPGVGTLVVGAERVRLDGATARTLPLVDGERAALAADADGPGPIHAVIATEGRSLVPAAPGDRGLEVRRRWTARDGAELDLSGAGSAALALGELVHVEITLRSRSGRVENVAIVDALPGGVEVEHPALSAAADGTGAVHAADRVEFRDDRVIIVATAATTPQVFRYALRVTTPGAFALPPIEASCLYAPGLASLGEPGRLTVER